MTIYSIGKCAFSAVMAALLVLATWLYFYSRVDYSAHQNAFEQLVSIQQASASLSESILLVESGRVNHFDHIAKYEKQLTALLAELKNTEHNDQHAHPIKELLSINEHLAQSMQELLSISEHLKSTFSAYQNSTLFLTKSIDNVKALISEQNKPSWFNELVHLEHQIIRHNADKTAVNLKDIQHTHRSLSEKTTTFPDPLASAIEGVLNHATTVIRYSENLHELNRALLENQVVEYAQKAISEQDNLLNQDISKAYAVRKAFYLTIFILTFLTIWTWRKQQHALNQLKHDADRLQRASRVFNDSNQAIIITDANSLITDVNPAFSHITGYSREEVLGKNPSILSSGKQNDVFYSDMWRSIKTFGFWKGEIWNRKKNGELFAELVTISALKEESGQVNSYIGIFIDITQSKLQQEQLQQSHQLLEKRVEDRTRELVTAVDDANRANETKSEFLNNISHELRTPMHGILSFANFGINKIETASREKLLHYFSNIHISAQRLLVLVNDLLDLSKLEAGKVIMTMRHADLNDILHNCCLEQEARMHELGLTLAISQPTTPAVINCDPDRIGQVITNLLSNAIKFSAKDDTISIKIEQHPNTLLFSLHDQGVGIPENELDTIFDAFIQSSNTKTGAGGTGLGLAISKQIIELHHGRIWAENNAESGATFTFVIPLNQPLSKHS